jgi:hypothetical protein
MGAPVPGIVLEADEAFALQLVGGPSHGLPRQALLDRVPAKVVGVFVSGSAPRACD